jgi:hypothetical protein
MDVALSVSPLSGHGVALALHGAVLAAKDPVRYREWLLRTRSTMPLRKPARMSHSGGRTSTMSHSDCQWPKFPSCSGGYVSASSGIAYQNTHVAPLVR